jgi:hypothetical protein
MRWITNIYLKSRGNTWFEHEVLELYSSSPRGSTIYTPEQMTKQGIIGLYARDSNEVVPSGFQAYNRKALNKQGVTLVESEHASDERRELPEV